MHIRRHIQCKRTAGFNLVEVMITVSIMALIGGAISFGAIRAYIQMQKKAAGTECRNIRTAIHAARVAGDLSPSACPGVDTLLAAEVLQDGQRTTDPWDNAYFIECEGTRVTVFSNGPDGEPGTDDDISSRVQ